VTTQGGPVHASTVVVYYLYEQAFRLFHAGYATAIAYVVFLAILVLTSIQLWASRRVVHYSS
jgi:multiple sugar transport system permease protein